MDLIEMGKNGDGDMVELGKCPFCSNQGNLIRVRSKRRKLLMLEWNVYWVECGYCGSALYKNGHRFTTAEEAINAWNEFSSYKE